MYQALTAAVCSPVVCAVLARVQVDVGEPEPRTIVSGLVKFVSVEDMTDRKVRQHCQLAQATHPAHSCSTTLPPTRSRHH